MRRIKFEPDVMINAVQEYLNGQTSQQAIAKRFELLPDYAAALLYIFDS